MRVCTQQLLAVPADDRRFWELAEDAGKGAGIRTMSEALDRIEERGIERGIECGIEQGIEQGEEKMAKLVQQLLSMGRYEDVGRVSRDKKEREKLFEELAVK